MSTQHSSLMQTQGKPAVKNQHNKPHYLEFEQPIAELDGKIAELKLLMEQAATMPAIDAPLDLTDEIAALSQKNQQLTASIYRQLTPWQVSQVSRHPYRPYTLDYIQHIFSVFRELHGDRHFGDDHAIVGGLAQLTTGIEGHERVQSVMVIGHQKGRDLKERTYRNFGMPRPEGYRKAKRLMKLAEKFNVPIVTFVDTPGAYPGIDAEERGQSEAIGENLAVMATLSVPILTIVIGEGGSGGALAIAVADHVLMLQNSTYSVISPEGCASILWKDASQAPRAAECLKISAQHLQSTGLIDGVIPEPNGGAHRDPEATALSIKQSIVEFLTAQRTLSSADRQAARLQRWLQMGAFISDDGCAATV